jgi:Ca2+-transporting ATPase
MMALLLGGGVICFAMGELSDALILFTFATLSLSNTIIQEARTARGAERKRIAGREVVPGDFITLAEGDRVPADAILAQAHDLHVDESLLTGESVPVRKPARMALQPKIGSRVVTTVRLCWGIIGRAGNRSGRGDRNGRESEIGKIGYSLSTPEPEPPRLQIQTRRVVQVFAAVGGAVSLPAVPLYGFLRGGWGDTCRDRPRHVDAARGISGRAYRTHGDGALANLSRPCSDPACRGDRDPAIRDVLCTDKTGTPTENRMSTAEWRLENGQTFGPRETSDNEMPDRFQHLLNSGILASPRDAIDPMERAFHDLWGQVFRGDQALVRPRMATDACVRAATGFACDVSGLASKRLRPEC